MNLSDLFQIESIVCDFSQFCLVRHTAKELGDYLLDQSVYDFYQAVQKEGKFDRNSHILSFLVNKDGKTVFRGVYENLGKEKLKSKHFANLFLDEKSRQHYERLAGDYDYYHLQKVAMLSEYDGRLVIDWGDSAISWFQLYHIDKPKLVREILPPGYFKEFDDYLAISLTRSELEFLFRNVDGNPVWRSHLSKVNGIYLILDEHDGQQYIGSAYGKDGVWGRWQTYFMDPTGGNKRLVEKMNINPVAFRNFRYSLLEVFPGNMIKEEVIQKESLYKKKFGTRAFGLNEN